MSGEFWPSAKLTGAAVSPSNRLFLTLHRPFMRSAGTTFPWGRFLVAAFSSWPATQTTELVAEISRSGLYFLTAAWNSFWAGVSAENHGNVATGFIIPSLLGSVASAEVS